jgi:hypothetical protein
MFVSKNRTLLLIALAAMMNCADSLAAENQGWGNWIYNQLPSRSSLGYYGGSALSAMSPLLYTSDGYSYYPRYAVESAGTQMLFDQYRRPTLEQQRKAQLVRGLSAALAAAALSRNNDWWDILATAGMTGTAAGLIPSFIQNREEFDRERQEVTERLEKVQQEQKARKLAQNPRLIQARSELLELEKAKKDEIKRIEQELIQRKEAQALADLIKEQNTRIQDENEQQRKAEKLFRFFGY